MTDPWENVRFATMDQLITTTKMEGSCAGIHGYTTPECWPYFVVVAVGSPGNEKVIELAKEFFQKVQAAEGSSANALQREPERRRPCPPSGRRTVPLHRQNPQ